MKELDEFNVRDFADKVQELIKENHELKKDIKRLDIIVKSAICYDGKLKVRIRKSDNESFDKFLEETTIGAGTGGCYIYWKNKKVPTENGFRFEGIVEVTKEEMDEAFGVF